MHRRIVATLLLALCLLCGTARSDPFTPYFSEVRARLVTMRDDLVEPLTRSQRKRRALVDKVLAALDRVSTSYAADVKTARTVALAAARPLRDDPELPGLVLDLLGDLALDFTARLPDLESRLDDLPPSRTKAKAGKKLARLNTYAAAAESAAAAHDARALATALVRGAVGSAALETLIVKAEGAPPNSSCGDIPDHGVLLTVTGGAGVRHVFEQAESIVPGRAPGQTGVLVASESSLPYIGFVVYQDANKLVKGGLPVTPVTYAEGAASAEQWSIFGGGIVVVETSPTRVGFCIDATLANPKSDVVTVRGYIVITR